MRVFNLNEILVLDEVANAFPGPTPHQCPFIIHIGMSIAGLSVLHLLARIEFFVARAVASAFSYFSWLAGTNPQAYKPTPSEP
jgi:hypothetical protein